MNKLSSVKFFERKPRILMMATNTSFLISGECSEWYSRKDGHNGRLLED